MCFCSQTVSQSVVGLMARHRSPTTGLARRLAGVDAGFVGRQAATVGPVPQSIDRFRSRDGHGDDVAGRLRQWDVEQCRQTAARADFCTRPFVIGWQWLVAVQLKLLEIELPDRRFLGIGGQVKKEDSVETLGP